MEAHEKWFRDNHILTPEIEVWYEATKVGWKAALEYLQKESECVGPTSPDGLPTGCQTVELIEQELNDS